MRVRKHLEDEEMFLANYADTLTDAPLPDMISASAPSDAVVDARGAARLVPPRRRVDDSGVVTGVSEVARADAVGERRLLRPAPGDLRRTSVRGRTWCRTRSTALARAAAARPAVHGLLAGGRHLQGSCRDGRDVPARSDCPWMVWDHERSSRPPRLADPRSAFAARVTVACVALGAHPDDIEIAAGGLLLKLPRPPGPARPLRAATGTAGAAGRGAGARPRRSCPEAELDLRAPRPSRRSSARALGRVKEHRPRGGWRSRPTWCSAPPRRRAPGSPARWPSSPRRPFGISSCSPTRSRSGTAISARPTSTSRSTRTRRPKVELLTSAIPSQNGPRLVGRRGLPGPDPPARDGVPARYAEAFRCDKGLLELRLDMATSSESYRPDRPGWRGGRKRMTSQTWRVATSSRCGPYRADPRHSG